jgi:hypothetical protein
MNKEVHIVTFKSRKEFDCCERDIHNILKRNKGCVLYIAFDPDGTETLCIRKGNKHKKLYCADPLITEMGLYNVFNMIRSWGIAFDAISERLMQTGFFVD